ncbi:hypothetical protein [Nostoc sp.]|uniref:hypothetical protein n=1 Tax=Nostoc sp. TaxID=1180 RepID=UPI002FEEF9F4
MNQMIFGRSLFFVSVGGSLKRAIALLFGYALCFREIKQNSINLQEFTSKHLY